MQAVKRQKEEGVVETHLLYTRQTSLPSTTPLMGQNGREIGLKPNLHMLAVT